MHRNILIAMIAGMAIVSLAEAQPDTLWTKTFGRIHDDYGYSVQQTGDGGYIITGETYSHFNGPSYVYLIKTDAWGNQQWRQTFGGSEGNVGQSVDQTRDSGYIIAGYTCSYGAGGCDVYLIKTDSSGIEQWSQTFGGSDWDSGHSVQQTRDGGYIIAGYTLSYGSDGTDICLIKTDASGIEQWSQIYGGSDYDYGQSVQQTRDGGYIIAGYTGYSGASGYDIYLIKVDVSGSCQWSQTFGGEGWDYGYSVQQTSDGGYIIAGDTESYGAGASDVYLIKTDASGNEQWSRTFGGSDWDKSYSVQQTRDGGYIIAGYTGSYGAGSSDVYLIKTDYLGIEQCSQIFGGSNSDCGYSVQQTGDGGYIIAGYTRSYSVGGYDSDVWLIRLASEVGVKPENPKQAYKFRLIPAYPNPFNPTTTIRFDLPVAGKVKLLIYNIFGCPVANLINGWRMAGYHKVIFDASDLASGLYIARLQAGDFIASQKMVLVK